MSADRKVTRMESVVAHPEQRVRVSVWRSAMRRREAAYGIVFASPFLLGLVLWTAGPAIASAVLSFFEYDIVSAPKWAGASNFVRAFTKDELFIPSLTRTFYYVALSVPLGVAGSLLLAWCSSRHHGVQALSRLVLRKPHPAVAMTSLEVDSEPQDRAINYTLKSVFGVELWLGDHRGPSSLVLMGLWGGLGGNRMLIFGRPAGSLASCEAASIVARAHGGALPT